jgi:tetratricopeptide (TPR) repeat protein/GTPase SAR1 family protein
MLETFAVIVGIGRYQRYSFYPEIPGAVADARWVKRVLIEIGLPAQNIMLLLEENATRGEILRALRVWPIQMTPKPLRLLIFFSCHGCQVQERGVPSCSVLLPYDSDPQDRLGSGLKLAEVILALRRLNLVEAYLFIDACYQSLDTLENVLNVFPSQGLAGKLPDEDVLSTSGANCFLCMVAAADTPAYENQRGFFTTAILSKLEILNQTDTPTIVQLSTEVEKELKVKGLPLPTTYLIGQTDVWPFDGIKMNGGTLDIEKKVSTEVHRTALLNKLKRTLRDSYPKPILFCGESGIGKTFVLNQLVGEMPDSVYISIVPEGIRLLETLENQVATAVAEQMVSLFPSGSPLISPQKTFEYIGGKARGFLVVIDHGERILDNLLSSLIEEIRKYGVQVLIGSRSDAKITEDLILFRCPSFSLQETQTLIELETSENSINAVDALAQTGGNPLRLRQLVLQEDYGLITYNSKYTKLLKALSASFGFIDIDLFSETFNIDKKEIYELQEQGLIQNQGYNYVPHDSILQGISFEHDDLRCAQTYWSRQMLVTRKMIHPARMLTWCITRTRVISDIDDRALEWALEEIWRAKEWALLKELSQVIRNNLSSIEKSIFKISEILVEQGNVSDTEDLVLHLLNRDLQESSKAKCYLLRARYGWWFGDYAKTIELAADIISDPGISEYHPQAHLEKGIAHFFRGEWDIAKLHLRLADNPNIAEPRTVGWSRLILGTIDGIRGVNLLEGKQKLESSIRILQQIEDYFGLCVAYGNLGEVTWKSGEPEKAWEQLQQGLKYAVDAGNETNQLENKRNQLHVLMRLEGVETARFNKLLLEISSLDLAKYGEMECMQVYNSLATVFAYKGQAEQCLEYIHLASKITKGNEEYEIYTLANKALYYLLINNKDECLDSANKAVDLALKGQNYLAVRQIKDDAEYVTRIHRGNLFSDLLEFLLSKWDSLETTLHT